MLTSRIVRPEPFSEFADGLAERDHGATTEFGIPNIWIGGS
jgi:hypothetical protein